LNKEPEVNYYISWFRQWKPIAYKAAPQQLKQLTKFYLDRSYVLSYGAILYEFTVPISRVEEFTSMFHAYAPIDGVCGRIVPDECNPYNASFEK
jgi:hypothetical protein